MAFLPEAGILLILMNVFTSALYAQSTENIGNVTYRFEDEKMLISYDIIKGQPGETYDVSFEILQPSGTRILPVSVYGAVGKGVVPGRKRSIIWDYTTDNVTLEEGFKIRLYGIPVIRKNELADSTARTYEIVRTLDMGIGLGLDYGGILGVRLTYLPIRYLGIFGCAGIQLDGTGWQAGVKGYIIPKTSLKAFRPYIKAMYGVNCEIFIDGAEEYNKLYQGFSAGAGIEFRFGMTKSHGINFDLNVPVRPQEYYDDLNDIKNNPNMEIKVEPGPVTVSFGYHFEF